MHLSRTGTRHLARTQGDHSGSRRADAQSALEERAAAIVQAERRDVTRRRLSRRSTVALALLGFVLVATGVIARRTYGIDQARTLRELDRRRQALEAERVKLDGEIRDASSRARLAPIAEQRLNMHVPSPDQVIMLPPAVAHTPAGHKQHP
ncbi:MAG: hypothetical protein DMD26_07470 [Gemmatimonadetes bacterium]|nr:MAG: hypothetical protein DMD26_07470 [Gemmatimonadota bacterium]